MANDNTRPFPPQPPTQQQLEAFSRLTQILKGGPQEYVPVLKSLDKIGADYKITDVKLGDETVECVVIPLSELMYREWTHMSGQSSERNDSDQ